MIKIIVCAIFCICFFKQAYSVKIECEVEGVELDDYWYDSYTNKKINDTFSGIVHETNTSNVTSIRFEGAKYLDLTFANNKLTVYTTDAFKTYEENEKNTTIYQTLVVECGEKTYTLGYKQPLMDINSHNPVFNEIEYNVVVYGELSDEFVLTDMINITVTDLDITDNSFDYSIEAIGEKDNKDFYIDDYEDDFYLETAKKLSPPYNKAFLLTAKDGRSIGESRYATALLNITLQMPEDVFEFEKSQYTASIDGGELIIPNPIKLAGGIDNDVKFTFSEYDFGTFTTSVNHLKQTIDIKLKNKDRKLQTAEFKLTLYAEWKGVKAETEILVKHVDADCKIENLNWKNNEYTNPEKINDTHNGVIQKFEFLRNIKNISCTDSKYIQCSFVDDTFVISTTDDFSKYEEYETQGETTMNVTVECSKETKTFIYKQRITDINTHNPKFGQDIYTYTIYHGLKKDFILTNLLSIAATDMDMTTSRLYFSIEENDDFEISSSVDSDKGRFYRPRLNTKRAIVPPYDETWKITVKDMSNDDVSLKSTVNLKIALKEVVDEIKFGVDLYQATVSDNNIIMPAETITLLNGIDNDLKVNITCDKYFGPITPKIDLVRNAIDIQFNGRALPTYATETTLNLTLKATWNGKSATTYVVIDAEKAKCIIGNLDWSKAYTNPKTINDTFSGIVQEFNETLNVLGIKCSGSKYLDCTFEDGIFKIFTKIEFEDFEVYETKPTTSVNISVECKHEKVDFVYHQKINDINNHSPKFLQEKYQYIFYNQIPSNVDLTDVLRIEATDLDVTNELEFYMPRNNFTYYDYDYKKNGKLYYPIVELRKTLESPFNEIFEFGVTDGETNATTLIEIKVISETSLKFNKSLYRGYVENGKIVLDEPIKLNNGFDSSTKVNITEEYEKHIQIETSLIRHSIEISMKKPLDDLDNNVIHVKMQAFWKNERASSILELQLDGPVLTTVPSVSTDQPIEPSTEGHTKPKPEPSTDRPIEPSTEEGHTKPKPEPSTDRPIEPSTEGHTKPQPEPSTDRPTEPPTEGHTNPPTNPPIAETTELPTHTSTKSARSSDDDDDVMNSFKSWLVIGNVAQITVFAAAGATIIGLLYASRSLCHSYL